MITKNRVLIIVEGGNVQAVFADDTKAEILLVDWDNIEEDGSKGSARIGRLPVDGPVAPVIEAVLNGA